MKAGDASSKSKRQEVNDRYDETLFSRLDDEGQFDDQVDSTSQFLARMSNNRAAGQYPITGLY
jgi:hypothetical protein